jgi:hypothetical protein
MSIDDWNVQDDNIDIEVKLHDGRKYAATLFTLMNVASLLNKFSVEKENANGTYFWSSHGIILKDLSIKSIESTIVDLVSTNTISRAMLEINTE